MNDIADIVRGNGIDIKEIGIKSVNYSDGPINPIIENPKLVKDHHVYLFQRFVDPFSEKPDHYVSQMILEGLAGKTITKEDIPDILNKYLGPYLRRYTKEGNSYMEQEYVDQAIATAEQSLAGRDIDPEEIHNNQLLHYPLEGLLRRMIHRTGHNSKMEEYTAASENLIQHDATGVTLVTPFLEGRSDKNIRGEANLSIKWAKDLKVHGTESIITWRTHSRRQIGHYEEEGIQFIQVYYTQNQRQQLVEETARYIIDHYGPHKIKSDLVVVGPDKGAATEAIKFADSLKSLLKDNADLQEVLGDDYKVPVVIMKKDRGGKISEIKNMGIEKWINIEEGKSLYNAILVFRDDIIDSVGTNERALRITGLLPQEGYNRLGDGSAIFVMDNGVLSIPGPYVLLKLKKSGVVKKLISPRTIEPPLLEEEFQNVIYYLSIKEPFAQEILDGIK